jgi:glutamine synthetase
VNSYKRLVPGYEAPVYISWGYRNRSSLVRIPSANEKTRRLELRSPDSSCNPYLAFAVMLSAGIDGIKNKIDPGVSVEENIYKFDDERRASSGLQALPGTLLEALAALEADLEMQKALGTMAYKAFMRVKKLEWQDYSITVSPWEFDRLLNV